MRKRFVFTTIRKSQLTSGTLDAIWKVFAWSMNQLVRGEWSDTDWKGDPTGRGGEKLADNWRGALIQVRGDWEFYMQAFHFPQWNVGDIMCWMCRASNQHRDRLWTQFGPDAGWRQNMFTHATWIEYCLGKGKGVVLLTQIDGFVLGMVHIDVLHTVDQGVASHVIGNIFSELVDTFPDGISGLWSDMKKWYGKTKCQNKLTAKLTTDRMKTSAGYPKLKAKAAQTRALAPYALELAQKHNSGSDHDQYRVGVAQLLCRFYNILQSEDMFGSTEACSEVKTLCGQFLHMYGALSREALRPPVVRRWKMVPKFHLFQHLCEIQTQRKGNPRFYWTYADEDLVGHMKEIAQSCHPLTMAQTCMYKWVLLQFSYEQ